MSSAPVGISLPDPPKAAVPPAPHAAIAEQTPRNAVAAARTEPAAAGLATEADPVVRQAIKVSPAGAPPGGNPPSPALPTASAPPEEGVRVGTATATGPTAREPGPMPGEPQATPVLRPDPAPPLTVKEPASLFDATAELAPGEPRQTEAPQRSDPGPSRAAEVAPRQVLQQILDQIQVRNGKVDVTLSPEELGRLTMTLAAQDGTLTVTIAADRAETLDLIRRHADILHQEARAAGFTSVSFGFSDHPAARRDGGPPAGDDAGPGDRAAALPPGALPPRAPMGLGTLDIRL